MESDQSLRAEFEELVEERRKTVRLHLSPLESILKKKQPKRNFGIQILENIFHLMNMIISCRELESVILRHGQCPRCEHQAEHYVLYVRKMHVSEKSR